MCVEDDYVEKGGDEVVAEVQVLEAEKVEEEPVNKEEGAEEKQEAGDEKTADTGIEKPDEKLEAGPPAPTPKKSGISMPGLIVTVLGAIGIVGAVILDPIMNMMDSSHSADIIIGNTHMMVVVAAAVVLIVGIVITVLTRKKPASG